ncbi:MAG: type IV pilus modification protein PilV [Granulosicoccus sp.]
MDILYSSFKSYRTPASISKQAFFNPTKQSGVGLIEILVAVVLISMGFLAAARMQVEGMRYSQSAYYQSQAYFLASDMIDRMRGNIDGVADGFYTSVTTSSDAADPNCDEIQCSPLGIARQDIHDWSANLYSMDGLSGFVPALPSSDTTTASGSIADLGNDIFSVTMTWNEVVGGEDTEQSLRVQFALESEDS